MGTIKILSQVLSLIVFSTVILRADTLVPRSGKTLTSTIPIEDICAFRFSTPTSAHAPASKSRTAVVIPAGTSLRVRTVDPIDVDASQAGMRFRGSLDDPIMSEGAVLVPRGAGVVLVAAKVQQGGRMKGSDLIQLKVNSIETGGRVYPVVTSLAETKSGGEGKKTTRKIVGGAGLGAIVGGIAGGGTGAGVGALVGGATGTAIAASGKPHLTIPPETRLQFHLLESIKLK